MLPFRIDQNFSEWTDDRYVSFVILLFMYILRQFLFSLSVTEIRQTIARTISVMRNFDLGVYFY